ncbi:MAG TPA: TonB C-terminal domain-containing protein [Micropepsaceae bacterium]|nr:TonB C-terminal domain-containing protein [Micropepsaceae bacterium]
MIRQTESPRGESWRRYAVVGAVALVFLSAGYGVYRLVNGEAGPKKRVVEVMALKLVPPPPPPPPKEEPPPPPPKMVEQKIEPPPTPDDKPKDAAPPPDAPLALDAQGGAGSDAFGLAGKPGGTPLTLGGTIGGGGGGGGNGFGHYASLMQDQISKRLREDDKLNTNKFRATIRVWLSTVGKVDRVQVMRTTGDTQIDTLIEQAIGTMPVMPEAPPKEMPQPVIVRVGALPGVG